MSKDTIGILGGGQLGAMLASAALRLGATPLVFMEDAAAPASRVKGARLRLGSLADPAALSAFLAEARLIAFENEFVDCAALRAAARVPGIEFLPSLEAIATLQDKLAQKKLLRELHIPTAEFHEVSSAAAALSHFPRGCVLKWSKLGYDGKGVFFLTPDNTAEAEAFFGKPRGAGIAVYAEARIAFKRELALVSVRARDGEFRSWPLVVSEQQSGICRRVYGPATSLGVPGALETQAAEHMRRLALRVGLVGVFAFELFETGSGELLVNEIAPRVHNSGHCTMEGSRTSQFENHVRAVLGQPLGDTTGAAAFAMLNLLGPDGVDRPEAGAPLPDVSGHGKLVLHWYGKSRISPRRKLGHVNGAATSAGELNGLLDALERCHNNWVEELRK